MLVVAGEPRSGTSLTMRLLMTMGFKIGGEKFVLTQIENKQQPRNPEGFWEIRWLPYRGLHLQMLLGEDDHEQPVNIPPGTEVIKLTTIGFFRSDMTLIDKVIFCVRDPREVVVSQRGQVRYQGDDINWDLWKNHMIHTAKNVKPIGWKRKIFILDYNSLMRDPQTEIDWLCKFLGKLPTPSLYEVINKKLYRSKKKEVKKDKEAKEIYEWFLKTRDNQRTYW